MSRPSRTRGIGGAPALARGALSSGAALVLALVLAGTALAASVANGGFETGDFTGWTVASTGVDAAGWFAWDETVSPMSGATIPAPPEGAYAAVADENDFGTEVLYQDLALASDFQGSLTFSWYYVNHASDFSAPATLDYTVEPNQQYRIDLVDPAADPHSVATSDVLAAIVSTKPGDPFTLAPTTVTFDLTPFAGRTVRLRFAAVENQGYLQAGVDAVSISSPPVTAPPPPPSTTPTTPDDCKLGGWQALVDGQGNAFRNQGGCVSWVVARYPGSLGRPTR